MDQTSLDNRVITLHSNEINTKKKVARRRWAILANALKSPVGSEPSSPTDEFSLRRISSFMLLTTQQIETVPMDTDSRHVNDLITKRIWYKYSITLGNVEFYVQIGHRKRTFSAEDLMGFNNTGNVCIWPSEETLAYYVCSNQSIFNGKNVLELGGGMSCLAGLFAAKYAAPKSVLVTDGNKMSVENVQAALHSNQFSCPVTTKVLKWGSMSSMILYDVILCADCLFFDDARGDLIDCLHSCLHPDGIALIMAPERAPTLDNFLKQSLAKGLQCIKIMNYNETVWEKRSKLLSNADFNDNIHYPILIEVTKCKADYWVSQNRKWCEFCKCWITDNKPSVEFHEKGKRHQSNVQKKLQNITKHTNKSRLESQNVDAAIQQMESAALKAYKKDMESGSSDITSINFMNQKLESEGGSKITKLWKEVKGRGTTYYQNIMTNEKVTQPPAEGFMSVEVQRELSFVEAKQQLSMIEKQKRMEGLAALQETKAKEVEERARLAREKLKERRVVEEEPQPVYGPLLEPGKTDPYGKWQSVQESPLVDLQLPEHPEYIEPTIEYEPEPPAKEFKEKTIERLQDDDDEPQATFFKKRKIGSGAKRNTRQRLNDD